MSDVNEGDWVVGESKWWWKYVMPSESVFWAAVLAAKSRGAEPEPSPWLQGVSGQVMDGLAMLNAAARIGKSDEAAKLKKEATAKITRAIAAVN
jgi:hypothetical protein